MIKLKMLLIENFETKYQTEIHDEFYIEKTIQIGPDSLSSFFSFYRYVLQNKWLHKIRVYKLFFWAFAKFRIINYSQRLGVYHNIDLSIKKSSTDILRIDLIEFTFSRTKLSWGFALQHGITDTIIDDPFSLVIAKW